MKPYCEIFDLLFFSGYDSVRGLTVRILSNRFSPIEMEKELGNFFLQQKMVLEQLTEEEIKSLCESLVKSLQDPPTTYTEEASEFWDAVISGMPFDWLERVIKVLEEIKKEDVVQSINKWIYTKDKKSVSVMMFGKNHVAEIENMKTVSTDKITEASEGFFKEYKDSNVIYSVEDWVKFRDTLPLFSATKK